MSSMPRVLRLRHRRTEGIPGAKQQNAEANGRHQKLAQSASQHLNETAQEAENDVPASWNGKFTRCMKLSPTRLDWIEANMNVTPHTARSASSIALAAVRIGLGSVGTGKKIPFQVIPGSSGISTAAGEGLRSTGCGPRNLAKMTPQRWHSVRPLSCSKWHFGHSMILCIDRPEAMLERPQSRSVCLPTHIMVYPAHVR